MSVKQHFMCESAQERKDKQKKNTVIKNSDKVLPQQRKTQAKKQEVEASVWTRKEEHH